MLRRLLAAHDTLTTRFTDILRLITVYTFGNSSHLFSPMLPKNRDRTRFIVSHLSHRTGIERASLSLSQGGYTQGVPKVVSTQGVPKGVP